MREFKLAWTGDEPLLSALSRPIHRASLVTYAGSPHIPTIWDEADRGVEIYAAMRDISERREIGVVELSAALTPGTAAMPIRLAAIPERISGVHRLVVEDADVAADGGLVLSLASGSEVTVVAGAFPCTLAISGFPAFPFDFQPEYELRMYRREPLDLTPGHVAEAGPSPSQA